MITPIAYGKKDEKVRNIDYFSSPHIKLLTGSHMHTMSHIIFEAPCLREPH